MQQEILRTKFERFVQGTATPAEMKQIDAWLSTGNYPKLHLTDKERNDLHNAILYDVQCYTAYPLFYPKKTDYLKKTISLVKKTLLIAGVITFIYFFVFYEW